MTHRPASCSQWLKRAGRSTRLHAGPGCPKVVDVQFVPCLEKTLLGLRHGASDALNRVDPERALPVVVDDVEVGSIVRRAGVHQRRAGFIRMLCDTSRLDPPHVAANGLGCIPRVDGTRRIQPEFRRVARETGETTRQLGTHGPARPAAAPSGMPRVPWRGTTEPAGGAWGDHADAWIRIHVKKR